MSENSSNWMHGSNRPEVELLGSLWGKLQAWHDQRVREEQGRTRQRQGVHDEGPAPTTTRQRKPRVPRPLGLTIEPFKSFPIECLPDPVREFVERASSGWGCDESMMALPVLSALASVIGNFRWLLLDESWAEPAALKTAIVGTGFPSQDQMIDSATAPHLEWQRAEFRRYSQSYNCYERELAEYRAASRGIRSQGRNPLPKPVEPTYNSYILDDVYAGYQGPQSWNQPRGLLVCRMDLYWWLRGRDSRSRETIRQGVWSVQQGDPPLWQECGLGSTRSHQGPYAAVSLAGFVSPRILAEAFTKKGYVRGRVARLLFAFPPDRPGGMNWDDLSTDVMSKYDLVIQNLRALLDCGRVAPQLGAVSRSDTATSCDSHGQGAPEDREQKLVELTQPARDRFARLVKEIAEKRYELDEFLWPSIENLECYAARLALILHLTRWACGERVNPDICDDTSMERGIMLANWFGYEATRFYTTFCLAPRNEQQRYVIQWLFGRGGQASIRQAAKTLTTQFKKPEQARVVFNELANAGLGWWKDNPDADAIDDLDRMFVLGKKSAEEPSD